MVAISKINYTDKGKSQKYCIKKNFSILVMDIFKLEHLNIQKIENNNRKLPFYVLR